MGTFWGMGEDHAGSMPVAPGRVQLPHGQEVMAKNQDGASRKMRWAAASMCLLLIALVGSDAARRLSQAERLGAGAASMAAVSEDMSASEKDATTTKARMMSMHEIHARAAANARLAHKAAAPGKVEHSHAKSSDEVHKVRDADVVDPNAHLVRLLKAKASVYEKAGSSQLASAQKKQKYAAEDKASAQKDIHEAEAMRKQAKLDTDEGKVVRKSFVQSELASLKANKEMKDAEKSYRRDALQLAEIYPKVASEKESGEPVPASLEAELKNVTTRLKHDRGEEA